MAWVRLDDQVTHHPKLLRVGPSAAWLWVCSIAYSQRHLTDGYLTREAIPALGVPHPRPLVQRLLEARLWEADGDGYRVHDYLEHNRSREDALAKRASEADAKARAGRAGGLARSRTQADRKQNPSTSARRGTQQNPSPDPDPDPDPKDHAPSNAPHGGARAGPAGGFERFWSAYPRKVGKDAARRAFAARKPDAALLAAMLAAIAVQRGSRAWQEGFIPHPATWLRQGRWQDELPEEVRAPEAPEITAFLSMFCRLYQTHRLGAVYLPGPDDAGTVRELLDAYGAERLGKLAELLVRLDDDGDEWIAGTDRGIRVLRAKAAWLDARLRAHEGRAS